MEAGFVWREAGGQRGPARKEVLQGELNGGGGVSVQMEHPFCWELEREGEACRLFCRRSGNGRRARGAGQGQGTKEREE
ncbi:hypothetical protein GCM10012319_49520 [Comamonas sp. KCTC 72670]|nr:hypothetical protein GCM10012319_49520 [Comamonas sp. KCTC 72670]